MISVSLVGIGIYYYYRCIYIRLLQVTVSRVRFHYLDGRSDGIEEADIEGADTRPHLHKLPTLEYQCEQETWMRCRNVIS